ncbi:hypothetical protein LINGRAHAP2_LOCUS33275 [Linum grandiflorum]
MESVNSNLNASPIESDARKETPREHENVHSDVTTGISALNISDDNDSGAVVLSEAGEIKLLSVTEKVTPLSKRFSLSSKKLLILDLNGLLVDVVSRPKDRKPDKCVGNRSFFPRPFYLDFLKFCFERFHVAVWSSRTKYFPSSLSYINIPSFDPVYDQSHCTITQFRTVENRHKPLVFKELKRVWEKQDSQLPWERGYFNESNTLLVDDSPYKALLNPVHSAIYPDSYSYQDVDDNSLGDGGNIRVYLEQICGAEHVQKFVEMNPFGQKAVNEGNDSWSFYLQVISTLYPSRVQDGKYVLDASPVVA